MDVLTNGYESSDFCVNVNCVLMYANVLFTHKQAHTFSVINVSLLLVTTPTTVCVGMITAVFVYVVVCTLRSYK